MNAYPIPSLSRIELDLEALRYNLQTLQQGFIKHKKTVAVVKADAYGHGSVPVAKTLDTEVFAFAVAQPNEAIELRQHGIQSDIIVLCAPHAEWASVYVDWNLIASVGHPDHLTFLPASTRVHLKGNTGMNRLGFDIEDLEAMITGVNTRSDLSFEGLFSHFANSEREDTSSMNLQLDRFRHLSGHFPSHWLRHINSSAAVLTMDKIPFDAVRIGLVLYGYVPFGLPNPGLTWVKHWKSQLNQIRPVQKGEPVGYGWTWQAPTDGWLGIIPVGYADGYPRSASNKTQVMLSDGPAQVSGRVTMDYITIFTDRRPLVVGEPVTLLGAPGCTADELALATGTIAYEILCQSKGRK